MNEEPRKTHEMPKRGDPHPELTEALEIVWMISELSEELIRRAQRSVDDAPLDDPRLLISAVETREAIMMSVKRTEGWRRLAA